MATLTVYPDPNTETTSVDGYVGRTNVGATFSDIRDGAGTEANDSATTAYGPQINHHSTSNTYSLIRRLITLFDTSALTSGATITGATLSYYWVTRSNSYTGGEYNCLVTSAPASNTALATGDYAVANFGTTELMTRQAWSALTLNAYNDWTLNASGLSAISKTGVTKFGVRSGVDLDNSATWQSSIGDYLESRSADYSGTTSDPKLVVTYSTSVDVTVSPSVNTATFSIPTATVTAIQNITVSPTVQTATFSIPTYTQVSDVIASPSVQTATFSIPTYTVTIADVLIQPSVQVCTFTIPAYTPDVTANPTVTPSVQVCTFTIPTYTVSVVSNITISPSVLTATFSILTYTALGDYWEEKFAQPATSWSDKIAQPNTTWGNKY